MEATVRALYKYPGLETGQGWTKTALKGLQKALEDPYKAFIRRL